MTNKQFPIISDDEVMLIDMPVMRLYDEKDLISNIKGDYLEPTYLEWQPIVEEKKEELGKSSLRSANKHTKQREKTYAEKAREQARADLKKKRSAAYLTGEISQKSRTQGLAGISSNPHPSTSQAKSRTGEFAKYGKRLTQSHYILADGVAETSDATEEVEAKTSKKNSYDFLKTSQVYNKKDIQKRRQHSIAQELNLTDLSEN